MYSRLLVPLDGSPLAEQALPYARILAGALKVPVLLVRVIPPVTVALELGQTVEELTVATEEIAGQLQAQAARYLEAQAEGLRKAGLSVETALREGNPVDEVARLAHAADGTLVVLASHGHTGLLRAWLGSVAQGLIHTLESPVLVVRAREAYRPPERVEAVVVGLDGSPVAEQVLPHASALARALGARLHLVHVVPTIPGDLAYTVDEFLALTEQASGRARRFGRGYLEEKAEALAHDGVPVTWSLREGNPARELVEEARSQPSPLLALTTHGRTGLGRWLLGSVTERVLHTAPCPVLVVRARA